MKSVALSIVLVAASWGPSWAGAGDGQKMSDFRKAQTESCAVGTNPNDRMGCRTWMDPDDKATSTGTTTPLPKPHKPRTQSR